MTLADLMARKMQFVCGYLQCAAPERDVSWANEAIVEAMMLSKIFIGDNGGLIARFVEESNVPIQGENGIYFSAGAAVWVDRNGLEGGFLDGAWEANGTRPERSRRETAEALHNICEYLLPSSVERNENGECYFVKIKKG